jgi:5-methylthioribose kinase
MAEAINPELGDSTEDLVFTEPYIDHPRNSYVAELAPVVDQMRADEAAMTRVQALKLAFMTQAEALIHGDLHTGSVMVGARARPCARAIDPEFCFYGPVAFDLGALFGNYLIARVRAEVLNRPAAFREYTRALPLESWRAFEAESWRQWPRRADAHFTDAFLRDWLDRVLQDAAGFGACKAIRRIVGLAKVSDIQTLEGAAHVRAATAVLNTARDWLKAGQSVGAVADLQALTDSSLGDQELASS